MGPAADPDLRRLIAQELGGVLEDPELLSDVGLWVTLVAREARRGEKVVMWVRPTESLAEGVVERVLAAAAANRGIRQPALLPVRRFGRTERLVWISVPEAGGRPLRQWFDEGRGPSEASALAFRRHVASPLIAMHAAKLVHGALSLSAFHRDRHGVVRVCCPGVDLALLQADIAAGVESEATALAAPEVAAGQEPDPAADQYGLAAILVELASGRPPVRGEDLPDGVPEAWGPSLRRALDPDPSGRFTGVQELVTALDRASKDARMHAEGGRVRAADGLTYLPYGGGRRRRAVRPPDAAEAAARSDADDVPVLFPGGRGERARRKRASSRARGTSGRRLVAASILLLLCVALALASAGDPAALASGVLRAMSLSASGPLAELAERAGIRVPHQAVPPGVAHADEGVHVERSTDSVELAPPASATAVDSTLAQPEDVPEDVLSSQSRPLAPVPVPEPEPEPEPARASEPEPARAREPAATPTPEPDPRPVAPAPTPALPSRPPVPDTAPAVETLERGRLALQSYPWGAVYVDGVFVGNTPILDVRVPAGEHEIRIEREPYDPYVTTVTVHPGRTLRLTGIVLRVGP